MSEVTYSSRVIARRSRSNLSLPAVRFNSPTNRIQTCAKKLGKKIKLARIELDLTQTQLAEKIDGKQKSISGYETGGSLPSIKTLVKIAKVLKKPAGHFLDD